ncbi:MAG: hypothetical protein RL238_589 [Actinomycetota bacterium]
MNRRRCLALLFGVAVLSACGVQTDESPRDIADAQRGPLGTTNGNAGGAASGTERIYLVGPALSGEVPLLEPVARTAGSPTELIEALLAGANSAELEQQFRSAIPAGTELNSVGLQAGTLRIDLSTELQEASGDDLIDALAQLVFTSAELDGVRQVRILVDGAPQLWPVGDGTLTSEPLTVYDYPGRVATAQPDYPAIPTPDGP